MGFIPDKIFVIMLTVTVMFVDLVCDFVKMLMLVVVAPVLFYVSRLLCCLGSAYNDLPLLAFYEKPSRALL